MSADIHPTAARRWSLRPTTRELLQVAIFAVIFIVVSYVVGMLSLFSPVGWLLSVPAQAVVGGLVIMLFFTKVTHPGLVTLLATVVALFFVIGGSPVWSVGMVVVLGIAADLVLAAGRYRSRWAAIWAYTIFSLSFFAPFVPLLIDREGYFQSALWEQMGAEFTAAADALFTPPVLGALAGGVLVAGFAGALLGAAALRKHFTRAGLA